MPNRLVADLSLSQIDDFFSLGKTPAVSTVPRSRLDGHVLDPETGGPSVSVRRSFIPPYKRHTRANNPMQTAYAEDYRREEEQSLTEQRSVYSRSCAASETSSVTGMMSRIDLDSTITGMSQVTLPEGMTEDMALSVYQNYEFRHKYDEKLSITKHRQEILRTVENYPVTVIQGETGSGKTTQVAQYLLDEHARTQRYCNIVVTQPRKIAAISIATHVCRERGWQVGNVCGYQVGMDKQVGEDTRLLYCTTGILLNRLISRKHMRDYTHIILDEVHERDQNSDFCLLVVRKLLRSNSSNVKVILMSATIDSQMFANYFSVPVGDTLSPSPILTVQGRTYKVSQFFLDHLTELADNLADQRWHHPSIPGELYELAVRLIDTFDEIEAAAHGEHEKGISKARGSVLVFLPGILEINELDELLNQRAEQRRYRLLPLHSTLTGQEQATVFHKPAAGERKIILSTNIAESSITVPDIKYVIDFCLTKNLECDQDTNYSMLKLQWASKANCKQRMGRAGRVANGRVYRMVWERFYDEQLPDYTIPEMQRCPLDSLVLQVKLLDLGEPKAILGLALSPPNLDDLERTILVLKEVGALTTLRDGAVNVHDGELTFMGRVLGKMPVDVRLGKLMLLGYVFGCLHDCIIIAAALSLRTFFAQPFKAQFDAYRHKLMWAGNPLSDCIAMLNAYKIWEEKKEKGWFRTLRDEYKWGEANFLQIRRLMEVQQLIADLTQRLQLLDITVPPAPANRPRRPGEPAALSVDEKMLILKLVMCGAFYPNYFIPTDIDEDEAIKTLSGKNPLTTVWVRGLPVDQGILYKDQLAKIFWQCDPIGQKPRTYFEQSRAYIEFHRDPSIEMHSRPILPAVYSALKLRLLRTDLDVTLVTDPTAHRHALNKGTGKNQLGLRSPWVEPGAGGDENSYEPRMVSLPSPEQTIVPVYVTEVLSPSNFWVYFADPATWNDIKKQQEKIQRELQHYSTMPRDRVLPGAYCLAPYEDDSETHYYRARIQSIEEAPARSSSAPSKGPVVKLYFMDYGNVDKCLAKDLKVIPKELFQLPFQAVSCSLAQLKPSPLKCPNGEWTPEAIKKFSSLVSNQHGLLAKIYSIVDGALRVELYNKPEGRHDQININQELKDSRYAQTTDESKISINNHKEREEQALMSHAPVKSPSTQEPLQTLAQASQQQQHLLGVKTRGGKVIVQGPWNPYEVSCQSMTNVGRTKQARIENESVNCVLVDEEPQCRCSRLVTAAHVSLSQSGNDMQLRQTTVMPKIPGLPAVVAMLFAPKAELRTNAERTRYTGALCGLGYDDENEGSALPDHDMEIVFDTEFDKEDLGMINKVRLAINLALDDPQTSNPNLINIQKQACQILLQLIKRERERVEPHSFRFAGEWNQVAPEHVLCPQVKEMQHVLYHLHNGIGLHFEDTDEEDDEDDEEGEGTHGKHQRQDRNRLESHPQSHPQSPGQKVQKPIAQSYHCENLYKPNPGNTQNRFSMQRRMQSAQQADPYYYQPQPQPQTLGNHFPARGRGGEHNTGNPYKSPHRPGMQNGFGSDYPQRAPPQPHPQAYPQAHPQAPQPIGRPIHGQSVAPPPPRPAMGSGAVGRGQQAQQMTPQQRAMSQKHIADLHALASMSQERRDIICYLCQATVHSPKELLLHLQTRVHRLREEIVHGNC